MFSLYFYSSKVTHDFILVNLETLLVLNVWKVSDSNEVILNLIVKENFKEPQFKLFIKPDCFNVINEENVPLTSKYCKWPVGIINNKAIAGLCSVSRQIIKDSINHKHLLGFREACLVACSETSLWTKFCEVDIINALNNFIQTCCEPEQNSVPKDLTRFENHMGQPIRIHNVYNVARIKSNDKSIKSSVPIKDLSLSHTFSEGPFITLADILLFPCIKVFENIIGGKLFENVLPLTKAWLKLLNLQNLQFLSFEINDNIDKKINFKNINSNLPKESLYSSDPNRYKPQKRIYTKQEDIVVALNILSRVNVIRSSNYTPFGSEVKFDWGDVPLEANPEGGALPKSRSARKSEQLENIAKAAIKIVKDNSYTIVDFCSGSGHLGILLAFLLPNCNLILVENKERSLSRAQERITSLNLKNITLVQCNLDYFIGDFDLGISLHACGVATDLVMQTCLNNKAHFICCPCCYGGIQNCNHLKYPRSNQFKGYFDYKYYLNIAHGADQTHDKDNVKTKQGYFCMDVIDTDRKLYAELFNYEVYLGKLDPPSCTPKNNLLVGIYTKI